MSEKSIFSVVGTLAPSILIGSSSFLEVARITITILDDFNFSRIRLLTVNIFKKKLCPVTGLVDSQVSDRCPWATCLNDSQTIALAYFMAMSISETGFYMIKVKIMDYLETMAV